jgi:hypothetical protein
MIWKLKSLGVGKFPAKTQSPAKESDCHFDQREKSFLDPSHFVRDDPPGVSLGDFAPCREKVRDFFAALPRGRSGMKISSHQTRKNLNYNDRYSLPY